MSAGDFDFVSESTSSSETSSFYQYSYCALCSVNHDKGRKHVFSKHHKERLRNSLASMLKKIKAAKEDILSPVIKDSTWNHDKHFWCCMCNCELERHLLIPGEATVLNAGLLKHLQTKDHLKSMKNFWWLNKCEKEKFQQFLFSEKDAKRFDEACIEAVTKFKEEHSARFSRAVNDLKWQQWRSHVTMAAVSSVSQQPNVHGITVNDRRPVIVNKSQKAQQVGPRVSTIPSTVSADSKRIRTVSAKGDGLTCIRMHRNIDGNNVHSGGVPPWLQQEVDETPSVPGTTFTTVSNPSASKVGPSMEDYQKHLRLEKKSKLNPNRVGAKRDRGAPTRADWLPSFGRVWNNKRRSLSRRHFRKLSSRKSDSSKQLSMMKR